jgi:hypothetical protein
MASSTRTFEREREEERRLNLRTLTIASAASASAAAVTSQLWIAGTWIAAALTPVLVALISEALHRPTERVARVSRRVAEPPRRRAAGASLPQSGEAAPVRVYRQPGSRPSRRRLATGVVIATAALAFGIAIVALTTVDLVSGGSVGKGSGRTTLLGGGGGGGGEADSSGTQDSAPSERQDDSQAPAPNQRQTTAPAPEQTVPDQPPTDTAPVTPPAESPPPGEPAPETAP